MSTVIYYDDKFELIRRMYFEGNKRKDIYAQDILVGAERKAFIQEHGICILKNDALQQLRQL